MIVIVMGVTGSGKTTVGKMLAQRLGAEFADADDFHSAANKDKMHRGIPLTDADRMPWLVSIHDYLAKKDGERHSVVLGCSALKQSYRAILSDGLSVQVVYLKGSYEVIDAHLRARKGHFADDKILAAQFADLEEPTDAIVVDVRLEPEQIVDEVCKQLK
ncbi:MAG TPA: gluconokinase [Candidatus Acidoferrum sp.]|jgi:gluconokinase|nr:gluconokinase [Candidatus Acidoferrum sp.]